MATGESDRNEKFACINNFESLKCDEKTFVGDEPDARNCTFVLPDIVQTRSRNPKLRECVIKLTNTGIHRLPTHATDEKTLYLFHDTEEIQNLYYKKTPNKRERAKRSWDLRIKAKKEITEAEGLYNLFMSWALRSLEEAVDLDPTSAQAHLDLGRAYTKRGNGSLGRAVDVLKSGVNLTTEPRLLADFHDALGLALSSQGDLADSKVEFDEALKYASDKWARARTLTHRGVASERSGLYQEARKDAESALKEWPGYRPAEALIARLNKKR